MKKFLLPFMFMACLLMVSCSNEDTPENKVLFETVECSSPANILLDYYSPDPHCVPPMYWISVNNQESELIIKCTTASDIVVDLLKDFNEENVNNLPVPVAEGEWSLEKIDSNTLKFKFNKVNVTESTPEVCNYQFDVKAPADNASTSFYITRYMKVEESLER
ncbi:MAG: hypothetical protein K2M01_02280 [Paramuribaculum sp.]|nr:hypothetical protein [Paramuribaculum sp.]